MYLKLSKQAPLLADLLFCFMTPLALRAKEPKKLAGAGQSLCRQAFIQELHILFDRFNRLFITGSHELDQHLFSRCVVINVDD